MVKSITKLILGTCMFAGVMYGSDVRCMEEVKEREKGITFDSTTGVLTIEKSQKEDIAEFPLPEGVRPDQVIKMAMRGCRYVINFSNCLDYCNLNIFSMDKSCLGLTPALIEAFEFLQKRHLNKVELGSCTEGDSQHLNFNRIKDILVFGPNCFSQYN